MKHDPRRVLEILLDELTAVFALSPEAAERCRRQIEAALRPQWPVLFLATGDAPPCPAAMESFRALTAMGIEARLIRSHSFSQVWPLEILRSHLGAVTVLENIGPNDIPRLPETYPLLCVLTLSSNAVAKTILGLSDSMPSRVLRAFLDRGKPVVVAGLPPQRLAVDDGGMVFWGLPLAVRQWLADGYRTLEQWGAEFVEHERLTEAVRRRLFLPSAPRHAASEIQNEVSARRFITADDVRSARARGEARIAVPAHATVTDEAREFARRWGIVLLE